MSEGYVPPTPAPAPVPEVAGGVLTMEVDAAGMARWGITGTIPTNTLITMLEVIKFTILRNQVQQQTKTAGMGAPGIILPGKY